MKKTGMRHDDRADDRPGAGNRFQAGAARADPPTEAVNRWTGRHCGEDGEREPADGVESVTRPTPPPADATRQDAGGRQDLQAGPESGIGYQPEGAPTHREQSGPDRANMLTDWGCGRKPGRKVSQPADPDAPQAEPRKPAKDKELGGGGKKKEKRGEKRPTGRKPGPSSVLSERERRFVDAYCGVAKGNAQEAARIAGYKHAPRAAELLSRDRVRAEVKKRAEARGITADMVLGRVALIATADMADYAPLIGCKSTATARRVLAQLQAEGKTLAIRRLIPSRWGLGVELYPADAALALAGKHLGLFRDQVEMTVNTTAIDQVAQRRLLEDPRACELAATLDARLALPAPDSPPAPENGPGLPSDEPIDVEWSNLPGKPDKPA